MLSLCSLDRGVELSDAKIIQLKNEITRLHPTMDQLQQMHDRFLRNNNFGDFGLHRFTDHAIPLFTQQEMEEYVDREIASMLQWARQDIARIKNLGRQEASVEYLHLKELHQEMEMAFYARMDERKQKERRQLTRRLLYVKTWLSVVDRELVREAFLLARDRGDIVISPKTHRQHLLMFLTAGELVDDTFPTENEIQLAPSYGEVLFNAVEILMRRLPPCQCDSCTSGHARLPATSS